MLYFFMEFSYIIYTVLQCDLPPLIPNCRAEIRTRAGQPRGRDITPRPPHLFFREVQNRANFLLDYNLKYAQ